MDKKQKRQSEFYRVASSNFDKKRLNSNHLYKIEEIGKEIFKYSDGCIRCLELGGGTGIHAEQFIKKYYDRIKLFVFNDLSAEMLNIAKKRMNRLTERCNLRFAEGTAEEFSYGDEKFDAVYVSGAMHHFSNYDKAINNINFNLNEDGIVVICEPIIQNPYSWIRVIFQRQEWGQFIVTRKNVLKSLKANGFEILENRVLHYRSNNCRFRFILKAEKCKILDWIAVMFLVVARKKQDVSKLSHEEG